jgi:hypothetical protein
MSNKSARKVSLPKPNPTPRELQAIKDEYAQTLPGAGQLQYEIEVKKDDLSRVNRKLRSLNEEAAARIELDKASSPKEEPKKEETSV